MSERASKCVSPLPKVLVLHMVYLYNSCKGGDTNDYMLEQLEHNIENNTYLPTFLKVIRLSSLSCSLSSD